MVINFRRSSSGFAYLPGLTQSKTLDTATLPPEVASRVEQLVQEAALFESPASTPPLPVRDAVQYSITVASEGRQHTVEASEPMASEAFKSLFKYLESVGPA